MRNEAVIRPAWGGTAVVCCVHDREKRKVTSERDVFELGLAIGVMYDPNQHKLHRCSCCDNLFVDPGDEPRYCSSCQRSAVHALAGPLPEPKGVID